MVGGDQPAFEERAPTWRSLPGRAIPQQQTGELLPAAPHGSGPARDLTERPRQTRSASTGTPTQALRFHWLWPRSRTSAGYSVCTDAAPYNRSHSTERAAGRTSERRVGRRAGAQVDSAVFRRGCRIKQFEKGTACLGRSALEPPYATPLRRTACVRRTRWPVSEPTLTSDPAASLGVFPTATDEGSAHRRHARRRRATELDED
jgi:hypothetical protein